MLPRGAGERSLFFRATGKKVARLARVASRASVTRGNGEKPLAQMQEGDPERQCAGRRTNVKPYLAQQ